MIECVTKNGVRVWVSRTYDCEPNLGGFFCQIYLDDNCNREIGDFVVPADIVDSDKDIEYIKGYIKNYEVDITYEWCLHCDEEVILLAKKEAQACPSCGKLILPCSLCKDCEQVCPIDDKLKHQELAILSLIERS